MRLTGARGRGEVGIVDVSRRLRPDRRAQWWAHDGRFHDAVLYARALFAVHTHTHRESLNLKTVSRQAEGLRLGLREPFGVPTNTC